MRLEFLTAELCESSRMYIVAIAWIYVILMMATTANSFIAGAMTFLLYGVLPLAIVALLFGRARRTPPPSDEAADRDIDQHDGTDAERDQ